ncbi:MAG: class I SAM-dependent methyltransferase [Chitinophagales bacterium]
MPLLEKRSYRENWFSSDEQFDELYPVSVQSLTSRHWSPLNVTRKAADFLAVDKSVRILDIGSGVGKFCLGAAYFKPKAFFYGVEQRKGLVSYAKTARKTLLLENVSFFHGNFTMLDFRNFDHFYFYNSFYENLIGADKIDNSISYSGELYNYYNRYLYKQLEQKPKGTKIATFHSLEDEIPPCYRAEVSEFDSLLKFWIKV